MIPGLDRLSEKIGRDLFPDAEPLSSAEESVATFYISHGWTVENVKGKIAHFALWCDYEGRAKIETHLVSVCEYDGEFSGTHVFQYAELPPHSGEADFPNWLPEVQVCIIVDHPRDYRPEEVRLRLYKVDLDKVSDLRSIRRVVRSTKADIREQRKIVIMDKRERSWSWAAIAREVGLSRSAVRKIWMKSNAGKEVIPRPVEVCRVGKEVESWLSTLSPKMRKSAKSDLSHALSSLDGDDLDCARTDLDGFLTDVDDRLNAYRLSKATKSKIKRVLRRFLRFHGIEMGVHR
jgi:hypothetical protein